MTNKPLAVHQHSYTVMVNDDTDYQPIEINEDTMLVDDDYGHGNFCLLFIHTYSNNSQDKNVLVILVVFILYTIRGE